ncbi:MAG: YafY family transcriptional regulator [Dehalococcoidia bacterium]|nr:YafY family transcriptional regulator [Dehalococcoidia bacterium]
MRRADRLFRIIQLLRRRNVATAAWLAGELEVSERTVYRDIRDLTLSGVPIEGEAGVGYILRPGFDLPPLMFTEAEIEAMVLGARVVTSWADPAMAKAAADALARVEAVLPDRLRARLTSTPLFAPGFHVPELVLAKLAPLRGALDARRKVRLAYTSEPGDETDRIVRPLGLFFWGTTWSLTAWCELRQDFRSFRLDRMRSMSVVAERFADEPGRTIEDYFARVNSGQDW